MAPGRTLQRGARKHHPKRRPPKRGGKPEIRPSRALRKIRSLRRSL